MSLIATLMKQTRPARNGTAESDADLLGRFVERKDEAAFAAIVRRHAPLVWAVCRNALPTEADAEDAFQATFLALVRHAGRVARPAALAAWLHGSAVRVCALQRRAARRRANREARVARANHTTPALGWADDMARAHEAIRRLPRREHEVLVLCVLEGLSQFEAAQRLDLKLNSVSGLLARARQRLRRQLTPRGTLALVPLAVAASCPAAVPGALLHHTCRLAGPAAVFSRSVLSLATSLSEVTMRKFLVFSLALVAAAAGLNAGTFLTGTADAQPPARNAPVSTPDYPAAGSPTQGAVPDDRYPVINYQLTPSPSAPAGLVWEYKVLMRDANRNVEPGLNQQGAAGWELCTASPASDGQVLFVFKRLKSGPWWQNSPRTTTAQPGAENQNPYDTRTTSNPFSGARTTNPVQSPAAPPRQEPPADYEHPVVIALKRTDARSVADLLRPAMPSCRIALDARTNSLLLQGPTEDLNNLRKLLQRLDAGPANTGPAR